MSLINAIKFIRYLFWVVLVVGVISILLGIVFYKNLIVCVCVVLLGLTVLFSLQYLKRRFTNYYLKITGYPFEFLSMLEQLGYLKNQDIQWPEDPITNAKEWRSNTSDFLSSNQLKTRIGDCDSKMANSIVFWIIIIIMLAIYEACIPKATWVDFIFFILTLVLIGYLNIFYRKPVKNDPDPILEFGETGLFYTDSKYQWSEINNWYHDETEHSEGFFIITMNNSTAIKIDLDMLNISVLELMLLFTHFKRHYDQSR